ncbi:MAG TPA: succinate dehydrogenase, hydrophobic membrane anchor protein [Sphingobium sp.]|nr:succinate dehydrogenase, hydrophobic membrane anchor protein [Sphingobium sp.]
MKGGTRIGRVRGLGSARTGTHHWISQRITAVGNIILVLWLLASLLFLPALDYGAVTGWLAQPLVAVPMILMVANLFYHLRLGLQVLIEDYLHGDAGKLFALLLLNFYAVAGAALGIFSIAKIAFTGAAG